MRSNTTAEVCESAAVVAGTIMAAGNA